jgi:hypothetical protein
MGFDIDMIKALYSRLGERVEAGKSGGYNHNF